MCNRLTIKVTKFQESIVFELWQKCLGGGGGGGNYLNTKHKKLYKRQVKILFESANCVVSSYKMQIHC